MELYEREQGDQIAQLDSIVFLEHCILYTT